MQDDSFAQVGSLQLVASKLIELGDTQRKALLMTFDSETRCRIVEEMVNIKIQRGRK
jgi:hypothetical protein